MRERLIKKMPDRETLEAFVEGHYESPKVIFDKDAGSFRWLKNDRPINTNTSKK